ncbi:hypothetical protein P3T76_012661 [Phytophthora citrophthora]|uniref:Uncharacterized protein n=1 Tax=Phytophthora citrophthora TaxID=4793 RepID=A0AAD9G441_9STRA|nr:hypothetical protein P3T76_012661 [Phytophthora citrophthora]
MAKSSEDTAALAEQLHQERKKLTLFRRPFSVLYHSSIVFLRFLTWLALRVQQPGATGIANLRPLRAASITATLDGVGDGRVFIVEFGGILHEGLVIIGGLVQLI